MGTLTVGVSIIIIVLFGLGFKYVEDSQAGGMTA